MDSGKKEIVKEEENNWNAGGSVSILVFTEANTNIKPENLTQGNRKRIKTYNWKNID